MLLSDYDIECVEKAKQIIDSDLRNHVTIVLIAERVNMGKTKLKLTFRNYYGMGIFQYLKIQRMEKAADLLRETNFTLKKISAATGFKFPNNFNKAFTSYHGITPAKYRKDHKVSIKQISK